MKRLLTFMLLIGTGLSLAAQDLTILHLNDTHSHIEPERSGRNIGKGGVVEQAAYVDSVRCVEGKGNVLLLHAGDFSQGTSYFTELGGNIEIDILNAFGFDAVCLGNHEFDNGLEELARRLGNLKVPVVCANYDFSQTPLAGVVKPYAIVHKARKKIGIIGLLTDLSTVVKPETAAMLEYRHPALTASEYARKLREEHGCDMIICLTHLGYEGESYTDPELAAQTRGIDVIVGGHSHTLLDDLKKVKDLDGKEVVIVTDGKWGLGVGQLSVDFQPNRLTRLYDQIGGLKAFQEDSYSRFPYPAYEDRDAWSRLLGGHEEFLVSAGEKYLDYQWQSIPATSYLAYERTGERNVMQTPLANNRRALNSLLMAELAEGKGRFIDQLVNGVWHLAHMPSWVLSAHLPRQSSRRSLPDPAEQLIDLGSGALGAQMATVWHFFNGAFDKIDPVISRVVKGALKTQILDPYLNPDEQKPNWWLAYDLPAGGIVNNWNPWCNADVILSFLLVESDPERLDRALRQSAKSVDKFLAYVKKDGACEEGPAYWGHAAGKLYDYLQIMYDASAGRFSIFDDPQIKAMGEYISRSFVKDGWVVNFADASAKLSFSPSVIYNFGKAVGSEEMQEFALYNLADKKSGMFSAPVPMIHNDAFRALNSLRYIVEMSERVESLNRAIDSGKTLDECMKQLRRNVPAYTWYPQTEFCYMKNSSDWFFATKGGHNNESHNHNDIGTFILYIDGVPMFVDAGVGTYTKKTFSSERYTIWSMCSDWHNLPVINGATQKFGGQYRSASVVTSESSGRFTLDISGAYPSADCNSWKREYKLGKAALSIVDTYSMRERKAADIENFMVQGQVYLPGDRIQEGYVVNSGEVIVLNGAAGVRISYPKAMKPTVSTVELDDPRLTDVWGETLRRISFEGASDASVKGRYKFNITSFR